MTQEHSPLPMKTVLELYCEFRGWQGGALHEALADFSSMPRENRQPFSTRLADQIRNVSDPQNALQFMRKQTEHLFIKDMKAGVQ